MVLSLCIRWVSKAEGFKVVVIRVVNLDTWLKIVSLQESPWQISQEVVEGILVEDPLVEDSITEGKGKEEEIDV